MKEYRYFSSIILIGFGLFYFLKSIHFAPLLPYYSWGSLCILIGIAFFCESRFGNHSDFILPGILFSGFGLHQYIATRLEYWPAEHTIIFLLISLGLLLTYSKKGTGKGSGFLFLAISAFFIFHEKILNTLGLTNYIDLFNHYWPVLLMLIGGFLLFKKK